MSQLFAVLTSQSQEYNISPLCFFKLNSYSPNLPFHVPKPLCVARAGVVQRAGAHSFTLGQNAGGSTESPHHSAACPFCAAVCLLSLLSSGSSSVLRKQTAAESSGGAAQQRNTGEKSPRFRRYALYMRF